jgi:hypothetical protein
MGTHWEPGGDEKKSLSPLIPIPNPIPKSRSGFGSGSQELFGYFFFLGTSKLQLL